MAKKSSASSQPARLKSMRSEDIRTKQWTKKERLALRRIAERQAARDDSRRTGSGLAEIQGRRPPDAHQRHSDELDGGGKDAAC